MDFKFQNNQKVHIGKEKDQIVVTSKQSSSTPGIKTLVYLKKGSTYQICLKGQKIIPGIKTGNREDFGVHLWIGTNISNTSQFRTHYNSPESLSFDDTEIKIDFNTESIANIYTNHLNQNNGNSDFLEVWLGVLFNKVKKGDQFILKSLSLSPPSFNLPISSAQRIAIKRKISRVVTLIAMWGRNDIMRLNLKILQEQNLNSSIEHLIVVVVSNDEDRAFLKKYNNEIKLQNKPNPPIYITKSPNRPLGKKWQNGVNFVRSLNPDILIINGSDDLLSLNYIKTCCNLIQEGNDLVGPRRWFMYDGTTLFKTRYYGNHYYLGAGRAYSKEILDRLDWSIYDVSKEEKLDRRGYCEVQKARGRLCEILQDITPETATVISFKGNWDMLHSISQYKKSTVLNINETPRRKKPNVPINIEEIAVRDRFIDQFLLDKLGYDREFLSKFLNQ